MDALDRLNLLTDKALGLVEDTDNAIAQLGALPSSLRLSPVAVTAIPQFDSTLLRQIINTHLKSSKYPNLEQELAWRCSFMQHTGKVCNEVNGLKTNKQDVRKTCQRCKTARTNKKTLIEELFEAMLREEKG